MLGNRVKIVYLGIGSNLGNRIKNIKFAIAELQISNLQIIKISSFYESLSWPNSKKPRFINIVVKVQTNLNPFELLKICNKIELKLGRKRSIKNAPRTCDIDLIDYNGSLTSTKILTLPHPRAHLRNFVLYPLKEINPNWKHPLLNKKIDILIRNLNLRLRNEITRL